MTKRPAQFFLPYGIINLSIYEVLMTNLVNQAMSGNAQLAFRLFLLIRPEEMSGRKRNQYQMTKDMNIQEKWEVYRRMLDGS